MSAEDHEKSDKAAESRRETLKKFGRYAAAATPAMLMLLESNRQGARAQSPGRGNGRGPGNGNGRGGGPPGNRGGNPGLGNQGNSKPVGNAP